jgi:hypothetical protein
VIERLDLHLPPFRLSGKGTVRLGDKFAVDASIVSGSVSLAHLPQGLSIGGLSEGTLEVTLDIKGKGTNWKAWQFNGWVALTDGRLLSKELDAPISEIYLRLQLVRGGADIKRLALKVDDSDVTLSGSIRNWNKTPAINATIFSSKLDIDLLIPKGERSPARDFLEDLAATSRLAATVNIDRGLYKSLIVRGLSAQVSIRDGTVGLDNLAGEADGGTIEGRLKIHMPKLKPADAQASFRIAGMPYEKILQLAGDDQRDQRVVTGTLSATGILQGHGRDPQGVLHTISGKMNLLVAQGHIQKGTVVPKILTILNLPTLLQGKVDLTKDGLPFDKMSATLSITNGLVATENFLVDSPIIKITGAGSYDMTRDQMNVVLATSPLGSYSKLLKSIPLFGKLFAGERQGIDTALFEVKGPLKDPQVRYLPLQSFATGVTGLAHLAFDVLKNAIMLPKELIAPSEDQAGSAETGIPQATVPGVPAPATP